MGQFITYSQNNEDVIIDAYFKDVKQGTYVDVGANHPINDSVTKHFYEKGWRGINIEPIKMLYDLLCIDRPEDVNLQIGISNKAGTLTLREYDNHGLSTFSNELQNEYTAQTNKKTHEYKDVVVPVSTLKEVFINHPLEHIQFMKIDVEGFEYEVLQGNDWGKFRPEMICIESNHMLKGKDWRPLLEKNAYYKVWNDGLNDYYLSKESAYREKNFSYARTMLLSDQILPHHVVARIRELLENLESTTEQLRDEKLRVEVQKIRNEQLQHDNATLAEQLIEQQRFRNIIHLLFRSIDRIITAQIERLHVAKKGQHILLNNHNNVYDTTSGDSLLDSIQVADLLAYYSTRERRAPEKFYLYHILMNSYAFIRHTISRSYRAAYILARGKRVKN
jgi:FkbM family methyltransferase